MDYIEEDIEEGKGLLEDSRQGPDLWRDRFSGSRNRIRSYNTNTSSHSLSSSSDIPLRGQNKSDYDSGYSVNNQGGLSASPSLNSLKSRTSNSKPLDWWGKNVWKSSLGAFNFRKTSGHRRVMDRDAPFHQSFGRWNIIRHKLFTPGVPELFSQDKFHSLLNKSTLEILAIIFGIYIVAVALFAVAYRLISTYFGCNLDVNNMVEAYFFSLETMTTVGYGTRDQFFGGCYTVLAVTVSQACFGLLLDAILIGVLFTRLSRPSTRASTVVFSDFAVIRRVRGEFFFMFQVGELRKHQLLEAHVRCYAIRHDRTLPLLPTGQFMEGCKPETVHYQTHCMRLQHPNDDLGSQLLLVIPQIVVHRIEAWSPLMPPPRWVSEHGIVTWGIHSDMDHMQAPWDDSSENGGNDPLTGEDDNRIHGPAPAILRRQSTYWDERVRECLKLKNPFAVPMDLGSTRNKDKDRGLGYVYRFPDLQKRWDDVDGERGTWYEKMKRRVTLMEEARLAKKAEAENLQSSVDCNKPRSITNLTKDGDTVPLNKSSKPTSNSPCVSVKKTTKDKDQNRADTASMWFAREEKSAIQAYILDRELEILIILEGIDTTTGCTVQCRHSYSYENIIWDHAIAPCIEKDDDGFCIVDYEKFHDVRPAPHDCLDAGFVQSYA